MRKSTSRARWGALRELRLVDFVYGCDHLCTGGGPVSIGGGSVSIGE
jgi:hypothetical protein